MRKSPCCPKVGIKRGPWSAVEDALLTSYIQQYGIGPWRSIPEKAGLLRCGKGCRLRWMNYLRPGIKRGNMSEAEIDLIVRLHRLLGNRWSLIAGRIPGRTDNEIKNYWNTHLQKKTLPAPPPAKNKKTVIKSSSECNNNENDDNEANRTKIYVPKPIRICAPANAAVCKKVETPAPPSVEVKDGDFLGLRWEMTPESFPVTGDEVMLEKVFDEYLQLLY